jgi:hypothetical protein
MKGKDSDFFWPSFTDLMTSLFFIMLVLYILTIIKLKIKENELVKNNEDLKRKLKVYELVERNLKPLKEDTLLFRYEEKYKLFTLGFNVKFKPGRFKINESDIETDPLGTIANIHKAGMRLQEIIDKLNEQRALKDSELENVSYLLIISGYASKTSGGFFENYELSYKRALSLWDHWMYKGINFEDKKYEGLIDLQISGNGLGGVIRYPYTSDVSENRNQRFIIQIVPKIGNTK